MTRKILLLALILVTASFIAACKQNDDAKITTDIKTKIAGDESVDAVDIEVNTHNGVVTLRGKVLGEKEKERVIEIARSVPNVQDIISRIEVETQITDSFVEDRVEKEEELAQKTLDADDASGATVDDASTTAKVKLALAKDDYVSAHRIDVDTENGVVTLTGTVRNEEEAKRAIGVAKSIDGVKKVTSVLTVES